MISHVVTNVAFRLYPDNAPYPLLNERSADLNNLDGVASISDLRNAHDTYPSGSSAPAVYHGPWSFGQNPAGQLMCAVCNGLVGPFSQINGETFCGRYEYHQLYTNLDNQGLE